MLEYDMITLDAFLVFLAAALLPVTYILIVSRWIEPAYRQDHAETTAQKPKPITKRDSVPQLV